ncbi:hypothetical protein H6F98_21495 [Microcoleus sp. FACHB-SPT15]|uniref:hypothetical protein n=1 Tax=Microcoleus sp. FACHB-SPT15 TaxID=2692830 RepID=UPI00177EA7ED|nr:hypothetical protein [Microcoleus sp. FACHB-SPT15]MBD1808007.1 hypothetical protein [Microcoleus sp. FACHB-SPT15]
MKNYSNNRHNDGATALITSAVVGLMLALLVSQDFRDFPDTPFSLKDGKIGKTVQLT